MAKDVRGIVATFLSDNKNGDDHGNDAGKRPEDGSSLWKSISMATGKYKLCAYVENRQPAVTERRDGVREKRDSEENEEDLVCFTGKHAIAVRVLEDVDAADEEESGTKVNSKRDGDVAN